MEPTKKRKDSSDLAPLATEEEADWSNLESRFYRYLEDRERIGQDAQQSIFAWYAQQFAPGQRVLDVGSGQGDFLDLLKARGVQGFGLDSDPGMIAAARQRGHTIFPDDARHFLQTSRRRFDGIFMGNFVEHFSAQALLPILKGARRVLRLGGQLIIATPDPRSLHVHLQEFWRDATHVRLYDRDLLAFLVETCGFHVKDIGSNDATAYNPADEWFGEAFAQRLAQTARRSKSPSMVSIAAAIGNGAEAHESANAGPPMPQAVFASPDLVTTLREQQAQIDALDLQHLRDVVTRIAPEATAQGDPATLPTPSANGRPSDANPMIMDATVNGVGDGGTTPSELKPMIPERRGVAALRRWRTRHGEARSPTTPPPYRSPRVTATSASSPRLAIDLLMSVRDEVRSVAATSRDHELALRSLEAWLMDLGAVMDLTQQEAVLLAQAVRRRLDAIEQTAVLLDTRLTQSVEGAQQGIRDIQAATAELGSAMRGIYSAITVLSAVQRDIQTERRVEAEQNARQFDMLRNAVRAIEARIVAGEHAHEAVMNNVREQFAAFLAYLYPPREYYLVATCTSTSAREDV